LQQKVDDNVKFTRIDVRDLNLHWVVFVKICRGMMMEYNVYKMFSILDPNTSLMVRIKNIID
jgi:hypothetical protein